MTAENEGDFGTGRVTRWSSAQECRDLEGDAVTDDYIIVVGNSRADANAPRLLAGATFNR